MITAAAEAVIDALVSGSAGREEEEQSKTVEGARAAASKQDSSKYYYLITAVHIEGERYQRILSYIIVVITLLSPFSRIKSCQILKVPLVIVPRLIDNSIICFSDVY